MGFTPSRPLSSMLSVSALATFQTLDPVGQVIQPPKGIGLELILLIGPFDKATDIVRTGCNLVQARLHAVQPGVHPVKALPHFRFQRTEPVLEELQVVLVHLCSFMTSSRDRSSSPL